jgi:hypothetical protein
MRKLLLCTRVEPTPYFCFHPLSHSRGSKYSVPVLVTLISFLQNVLSIAFLCTINLLKFMQAFYLGGNDKARFCLCLGTMRC